MGIVERRRKAEKVALEHAVGGVMKILEQCYYSEEEDIKARELHDELQARVEKINAKLQARVEKINAKIEAIR